ncbi:MAG: hypothetical protein HPY44_12985 [Armatimonadetes bacterium]|nr:hypothetical protein [Armatimonadota bacterium]
MTKSKHYLFLGLLPLYIGPAAIRRPQITLYAGQAYPGPGPIFSMLCIYLFLDTVFALYRMHVIAIENRWYPMLIDTVLEALNVVPIPVLVLHWGEIRAAIARAFAVVLVLPLTIALTPRLSMSGIAPGTSGGIIALLFSGLWMHAFQRDRIQCLAITITPVLYLLFLKRTLLPDDANLMLGLVPGRLRQSVVGKRLMASLEHFCLGRTGEHVVRGSSD